MAHVSPPADVSPLPFPPTEQLFLHDTHLFECDAVVLDASPTAVVCNRTVFYCQGGGQPGDVGEIRPASAEGESGSVRP